MFKNVSIIGDGAMGTVMAMLLAERGIRVRIWGHDAKQLAQIATARENSLFLPGHKIPPAVQFQPDDRQILQDAHLLVSAIPCQYIRQIWLRLKPHLPPGLPIVSVTKGIENDTLMRPTQIIADVLGTDTPTAVLSGPTIADELARRLPATACVASSDQVLASAIQQTFSTDWFRIYTNKDIIGVELAGACKNVIAIAAGIIDGIGAGNNAKAALLSRGLAEITRLGLACGARPETFAGLAGLGDLVTTCISPLGRNRSLGERIGQGQTLEQALAATRSVVEGVSTCRSVVALATKAQVEMPITFAVYQVLFEKKPVKQAIQELMCRQLKPE
ncbi:MAG: NAD(P)H-dependent glycerol-3-phosphate dehydrogenase [Sedimentisphaerales bacterium]|nr:NAD(P)H-dependent glycerol-3-phosphate dehydrogenase [Sedimentisphaerales bacterium]